jgi:hypothetical protein
LEEKEKKKTVVTDKSIVRKPGDAQRCLEAGSFEWLRILPRGHACVFVV